MNPHPDSKWTHNLCRACYQIVEPDRAPFTLRRVETPEVCCFCKKDTIDGIYYRSDPEVVHPS